MSKQSIVRRIVAAMENVFRLTQLAFVNVVWVGAVLIVPYVRKNMQKNIMRNDSS